MRTTARRSLRKRKAASSPGQPPSTHTGVLRNGIFFAYDPKRKNAVIGPVVTNQVFFDRDRRPVKGTVPSVLEQGGEIYVLEVFKYGRWMRADLRSRRRNAGLQARYRRVQVRERPFMRPALAEVQPKLPALWANSIK